MNRFAAYTLGPELAWLLMLAITGLLVGRSQPPTEAGNLQLEQIGWVLPIVGVMLSFVPLAWAPGNHWWWLVRILVVGGVGVLVVPTYLCGGIDYGNSRNSGVGSGFILFASLGFIALFVGGFLAALFLFTNWRFMPFLKWTGIVVAVLSTCWGLIVWLASFAEKSKP